MVMDMMTRGGGGPEGAAAGPPPDLAALLGAGGPGAGPTPMPGPEAGPPPGPPGPSPGADSANAGGSELEALDTILQDIDAYLAIPTVSEGEKLIAEKMSTMAQQLKAQNEKMSDQISGGSPAARKAFG
jgi:hypothetical protein